MKHKLLCLVLLYAIVGCKSQHKENMTNNEHKGTPNHLISSTSPYLLQHAYNPVNWYPWGEEALNKAKEEDKPIILSIGYSSCHWCHVMERESFENDSIAKIMNDLFISIKVDREERPDVDQIYMDAVQAMGQNGGWPLNVFLTPDQKPFYGGTYFPPNGWAKLLGNISEAFKEKRTEINQSADQLANALSTSELIKYELKETESAFEQEALDTMFSKLTVRFDREKGGMNKAPKFPMPSNWLFLLRYHQLTAEPDALKQLELTLDEIANGGIYDQAGGGFARYSVDAEWLVPHFEKMLYDNGQLLSLYSEAYKVTGKELYKQVVFQTVDWLAREMTNSEGGFYAALDADSDGEEGKFYVWTDEEITDLIEYDAELMKAYYNTSPDGNWEHGKNILHKRLPDEEFAKTHNLSIERLRKIVEKTNQTLLKERENRVRPGLDDKALAGWNGLMLKGLVDAYEAFGEKKFLDMAITNAKFIESKMIKDGKLFRSFKEGVTKLDGYLEDYAFVIDGLMALYQVTYDEKWLSMAKDLTDYTLEHFYDDDEKMFFYTDNNSERLIARKKEVFDNVIPASNSQMAINLHFMGVTYDNAEYKEKSRTMIRKMADVLKDEPGYLSNWGILYGYLSKPTAEISIVGPKAESLRDELMKTYHPNKVVMGTTTSSDLPLMKAKSMLRGETTIYVCYDKTCRLPVNNVEDALKQMR